MFNISNTAGYAILALSCLEHTEGQWILAKDIAKCAGIPHPYLLKILNHLGKSSLIVAKSGYRGGFRLSRPASGITLWEIAAAIDGDDFISTCLLGLAECRDDRGCPTHEFWKKTRAQIEDQLKGLTLEDAARFEKERGNSLAGCSCESETNPRDAVKMSWA